MVRCIRGLPRRKCLISRYFLREFLAVLVFLVWVPGASGDGIPHQVLAFYYGWWGTPQVSGHWMRWKGDDPVNKQTEDTADFPAFGPYDSHDSATVDRQVAMARSAGITGFIASWWGPDSFEDQGMPLLLAVAVTHGLAVSAYYEKIDGADAASREASAIADLGYLLRQYGRNPGWLRAHGRPVVFVYGRAVHQLSPDEWQHVAAQVRRGSPGGLVLVGDTFETKYAATFDAKSAYNITGQTHHKTPTQIREWAHLAYPHIVAEAGPGKISTVTVIPGYDDRKMGRPPPRPVTDRWNGETYRVLWREAVAATPDYVLITSWNEWHEGTEIEPSVEYDSVNLSDTAAFARQFLAGQK
jgi:glycoprotein endo-alpha-1,2-mannosidase